MLDFYRDVVTQLRKFPMHRFNNGNSVSGSIENIGIAERNVLGARSSLLANVLQHHLSLHNAKDAVVDGNDWAMPAQMLAAAARLGVSGNKMSAIRHHHMRIFVQRRQALPVRYDEAEPIH